MFTPKGRYGKIGDVSRGQQSSLLVGTTPLVVLWPQTPIRLVVGGLPLLFWHGPINSGFTVLEQILIGTGKVTTAEKTSVSRQWRRMWSA